MTPAHIQLTCPFRGFFWVQNPASGMIEGALFDQLLKTRAI